MRTLIPNRSCDLVLTENNPPLPLRTSAASAVNSFFSSYFKA